MSQQIDHTNVPVQCPECGRMTDSLKCYSLPDYLVFVGVFVAYSFGKKVCCPHCMRKKILLYYFSYNIIIGNILWIILGLPMGIVKLCSSFTKGHSRSVQNVIIDHIAEVEAMQQQPQYPQPESQQEYAPAYCQYNYHLPEQAV